MEATKIGTHVPADQLIVTWIYSPCLESHENYLLLLIMKDGHSHDIIIMWTTVRYCWVSTNVMDVEHRESLGESALEIISSALQWEEEPFEGLEEKRSAKKHTAC